MDSEIGKVQQVQPSLASYQIAIRYQLGSLIAEYKKRVLSQQEKRSARIGRLLLIFLYVLMGGLLAFLLFILVNNLRSLSLFLSSSLLNVFVFALFASFLVLVYILLFLYIPCAFYRRRNPYILHCSEGLIYHRGGRITAMPWDEIESVRRSIWNGDARGRVLQQSYICIVRLKGKNYAFGVDIEQARELGRTIERELTRRWIASYWQRIQQGEQVRFGPLSIGRAGMYKGSELVLWEQVSQVHIWQGVIAITKGDVPQKWPLVRVGRIPNCFLFIALIHLLAAGQVSYQPPDYVYRDYIFELIIRLLRRIFLKAK